MGKSSNWLSSSCIFSFSFWVSGEHIKLKDLPDKGVDMNAHYDSKALKPMEDF